MRENLINKILQFHFRSTHIYLYMCIFMLFLISMGLWIGWNGRDRYICSVLSILMLFLIIKDGVKLRYSIGNLISFLFLPIAFMYLYPTGIGTIFSFILPWLIIIVLNDYDRVQCLHYITKWFAWLILICIIVYLIVSFTNIPSLGQLLVRNDSLTESTSYVTRQNYLFFVQSTDSSFQHRFNGPFVEPGHLGMMSAFLLFADGYNMKKKETWLIIIGLLLSYSLAGYVLLFLGFLFSRFLQNRISIKNIILFTIIIITVFSFASFYNGGDNMINEQILSRLQYDNDKFFTGNKRVNDVAMAYFASIFANADTFLFGYGTDFIDWLVYKNHGMLGSGFYLFMITYGLIGTLLAISFYFVFALFSKNKQIGIIFFIFILLLFWQRCYSFWFSWIICFVYGITKYTQIVKGK